MGERIGMDIDLLRECGKIVTFEKDQVICREGEEGHSMFVLLEGNVEVKVNSFSDNMQSVGYISKGSFFGEMSLLEKKPRTASVIAITDTVIVLEIGEANFAMLLKKAPDIAFGILEALNHRLNKMLNRIWETDKKFSFQYQKDATYNTIQKLDMDSFLQIAKASPDHVWTLLKYLSTSLEYLNGKYVADAEK